MEILRMYEIKFDRLQKIWSVVSESRIFRVMWSFTEFTKNWSSATAKAWIFQMMMLLYSLFYEDAWTKYMRALSFDKARAVPSMALPCAMSPRGRMIFVPKSRTTNFHLLHIIFFLNYSSHVLGQVNPLRIGQTKNSFEKCSTWSFQFWRVDDDVNQISFSSDSILDILLALRCVDLNSILFSFIVISCA